MKTLRLFLTLFFVAAVMMGCDKSSSAVNKAYDKAANGGTAIEVANILTEKELDFKQLDSKEFAKLGACIDFIRIKGQFTEDFTQQVNTERYNKLLEDFSRMEASQSDAERNERATYLEKLLN